MLPANLVPSISQFFDFKMENPKVTGTRSYWGILELGNFGIASSA